MGAAQDRLGDPQRYGVALDELVERRVNGLGEMIARGEAIGAWATAMAGSASMYFTHRNPIFEARRNGDCASGSMNI